MGFSIYAWITIVTVLLTFGILLFTKLRLDLVFLSVIGILFVTGVLDVNEALSGFSSATVAMVGVMFVVVAGLTYTGVLHWIVRNMLGRPKDYKRALLRLMIPVAVLSPFLNTAMGGCYVCWCRQNVVKKSEDDAFQAPYPYLFGWQHGCCLCHPCAPIKLDS